MGTKLKKYGEWNRPHRWCCFQSSLSEHRGSQPADTESLRQFLSKSLQSPQRKLRFSHSKAS